MDPLDLLTEDCWKEVLSRVEDPKDLWSCSEACQTFQHILRRKRSAFMLSLVLPHIFQYLPNTPQPEDADEDVIDIGLHFLPQWKSLLKCRLVSKSWRNSIDKLRDAEYPNIFRRAYSFTSGEGIEQFLQTFANHAGNPFLGRIVSFEFRSTPLLLAGNQALVADRYPGEDDKSFYIRKLRQLLERFGTEMWEVTMYDSGENLTFSKNIQMALSRLPNLHTLQLNGPFYDNFELDVESLAELTSYIAANPLPPLPRLRNLSFFGVNKGMMQFIMEKYAPQLESLFLYDLTGFPFTEHSSRLSNLMELHLDHLDASASLQALRELQSPLGKLSLDLARNRNSLGLWPIDELFRSIGHLPIRHLEVCVGIDTVFLGESGPIPAEQRPQHGSISKVQLSFRGGASFNFLLYCPQLTSIQIVRYDPLPGLEVGVPAGRADGLPELLDVGELLEQTGSDFYQSSIWDELHHLQDLEIRDYGFQNGNNWRMENYDRAEFEKRQD